MDEELIKLKDDMNYDVKRMQEIANSPDKDGVLSDEQKKQIEELTKHADGLGEKIKSIQESDAIRKGVEDRYAIATAPQPRILPQAQPGVGPANTVTFEKLEIPSVSPNTHKSFTGPKGAEQAYKAGLWLRANLFGQIDEHKNHPKVVEAQRLIRDYHHELRSLSTNVNSAGGITVPQEFMAAVIERREQFGVYEKLSNRVPINNEASWPRVTSDQMATFGGEGTEITAVDPVFDNVLLTAKSLRTLTRVNNELLNESAINLAEFLANEFGRRFAKRIDTIGFTANGEAANGGIVGAVSKIENDTNLTGNYKPTSCDNFVDVTTTMLATFIGTLPQYAAMGDPFFITNRMGKELVFGRLSMAAGGVTKQETSIGTFDTYSGIPIAVSQIMPGTVADFTNNDVMFLLADLRMASYFGVSQDLSVQQSSERYFEFNQTGFRGTMRCDSNVYDIGSSSAAGSVIGFVSD